MSRRVFVTGGTHGIGKSIVEAFAGRGGKVAFCDIDAVRGEQVAAQIGAAFYKADVTDAAQLEAAIIEPTTLYLIWN